MAPLATENVASSSSSYGASCRVAELRSLGSANVRCRSFFLPIFFSSGTAATHGLRRTYQLSSLSFIIIMTKQSSIDWSMAWATSLTLSKNATPRSCSCRFNVAFSSLYHVRREIQVRFKFFKLSTGGGSLCSNPAKIHSWLATDMAETTNFEVKAEYTAASLHAVIEAHSLNL